MEMSNKGYAGSIGDICLTHKGEELEWSTKDFDKTQFKNKEGVDGLFTDINQYWGSLPERRQDAIWDLYKKIHTAMNEIASPEELRVVVTKLVGELYKQMTYDEVVYFVRKAISEGRLTYPSEMPDHLSPEYREEQTYLRSDYLQLMAYVIFLRPMLPIWSEYMRSMRGAVITAFKESQAIRLIDATNIHETPGHIKLFEYILVNANQGTITLSALFGGLSSEQIADWCLGLVVVRKITLAELTRVPHGSNIVTVIFKYIRNTLSKDIDDKFAGRVEGKKPIPKDGEEQGVAELLRVKQELPESIMRGYDVYLYDVAPLMSRVEPNYDPKFYQECEKFVRLNRMGKLQALPFQTVIVQWVLTRNRGIEAAALNNIKAESKTRAILAAQAILWQWGFPDIAALITAIPRYDLSHRPNELSRTKIQRAIVSKLVEEYPYYPTIDKKDETGSRNNPVVVAINNLTPQIDVCAYEMSVPPALEAAAVEQLNGGAFPSDIKNRLALMWLKINEVNDQVKTEDQP